MGPEIEAFLALLFKWNRVYALTAFSGQEEAMEMGVKPSLRAAPLLPQGARVLDVGSGGGFPAVPIAITRPDLQFTLAEPSRPKAVFLVEAARELGLKYQVEARTAENLLASSGELFEAITVRGVHLRRGLFKRMIRAVAPGGALLLWTAGDRAWLYERWMGEAGLEVSREEAAGEALVLLIGNVPRGTSGAAAQGPPKTE